MVDNGSTDGSVEAIHSKFPVVTVIENRENMGFAAGNNVGIKYALKQAADFVFLLNNDTIVNSGILNALVSAFHATKNPGFLGCKIYFYDEPSRIQYFGGILEERPLLRGYHPEYGLFDDGSFIGVKATQYVTGCAMFANRDVWQKTGGFDEKFFLYWEDTDLSLKAANLGYTNYVVPNAIVYHKEGASSKDFRSILKNYYFFRNRIYFAKKHGKPLNAFGHSWRRIKALLKTHWELRCTGVITEAFSYLFGSLGVMGRMPAILNMLIESQIEKRVRLGYINFKKNIAKAVQFKSLL